jgi:hypothetical protein
MATVPSIGRASIPAEFEDRTSELLLIAPQPQFLHGRLIMSAVNASLGGMGSFGLPGREAMSNGAAYLGFEAQMLELSDPIAAEAVKVIPDFQYASAGKQIPNGHVIRFNRPRFTDSTYTQAVREVPAGSVISTTPMTVNSDQVPLVVKRWGGPYSNDGTEVRPLAIDNFDAMFSLHSLPSIVNLHFTRDFHKTIDKFGVTLLDGGDSTVYPDGMTADNDSLSAGDFQMDWATVLKTQRTLDTLHVPTFANGRRIMVLTPLQIEQLMRDGEFLLMAKEFTDTSPLLQKSYVKTAGNFDIYKSTTLTTTNNSSSVPIQYGQAFGPQALGVGPANMPRVHVSTNDNYGQTPMGVWLWACAFGLLDSSFVASVRSS